MAEKHRRMYEQRFPGTGISAAQAEERGERLALKEDRQTHRRTTRDRGITVPAEAWDRIFRNKEKAR